LVAALSVLNGMKIGGWMQRRDPHPQSANSLMTSAKEARGVVKTY